MINILKKANHYLLLDYQIMEKGLMELFEVKNLQIIVKYINNISSFVRF